MRWLPVSLTIALLVATIGLGWLFDNLYSRFSTPKQTQSIAVAEGLARAFAQQLSAGNISNELTIADSYKVEVVSQEDLVLPQSLLSTLQEGHALTLETERGLAIHALVPGSTEILLMEMPSPDSTDTDDTSRYWITSLFYLMMIGLLCLWLVPLIQRLLTLRTTAKAFGEGQLDQRIDVGSLSYIRDIETEFNHMAQRIENLVEDVRLLSSAVSHDLRTPLTKIQLGLDTLAEENDPAQRKKYEARIDKHVQEMVELVEMLLRFARLEQSMMELNPVDVSLAELLTSLADANRTNQCNIEFSSESIDETIKGDISYLKILFNNLIQNAINYGNGEISLTLRGNGNRLDVVVEDNGNGIELDSADTLFQPFIRGQHQQKSGFGLGLAMVKRIAQRHNAHVTVERSQRLNGAKFIVSFTNPYD